MSHLDSVVYGSECIIWSQSWTRVVHLSEYSLLFAFETYGAQSSARWIQTPRMGRDDHHQSYCTQAVVHISTVT